MLKLNESPTTSTDIASNTEVRPIRGCFTFRWRPASSRRTQSPTDREVSDTEPRSATQSRLWIGRRDRVTVVNGGPGPLGAVIQPSSTERPFSRGLRRVTSGWVPLRHTVLA